MYEPQYKLDSEILQLDQIPLNFEQATNDENRAYWAPAIKAELDSMKRHDVWEIVPKPKSVKTVPTKWIFGIKSNGVRKARLVAVGCKDDESYTNEEKRSPTPSFDAVCWLFAHVSYSKIDLVHLDVKTAFLHARINRSKYIPIPEGVPGNRKTMVCKLNKALYGLTLSPRYWYDTFDTKLRELGFERNVREQCLYTKKIAGTVIILLIYVDDVLVACDRNELIIETIDLFSKEFDIKNLGFPTTYIGIDVSRDTDGILSLTQERFLTSFLQYMKMDDSKAVRTPMLKSIDYSKLTKNQTDFPYKSVLGNLMWLSNHTRPDISFAVNFLARFQTDPKEEHWIQLKRIMRYLSGTRNFGLRFGERDEKVLDVFTDASFQDDVRTGKSTTGYVIRYHGNVIAWKSKLQTTFATSTAQAEYTAVCDASSNVIFIARLIDEILENSSVFPVPLFEDNSTCVSLLEGNTTRTKLKHLDRQLLQIRNLFEQNYLKVYPVASTDQLADILTKPLTGDQFDKLRDNLVTPKLQNQTEKNTVTDVPK